MRRRERLPAIACKATCHVYGGYLKRQASPLVDDVALTRQQAHTERSPQASYAQRRLTKGDVGDTRPVHGTVLDASGRLRDGSDTRGRERGREQPRGPAHGETPLRGLQLPVKTTLPTCPWRFDEKPGSLAIAFSTRDSDIAHLLAARSRARKHITPLRKTAPYYSSPLRQLFGTARLARP